MYRGWSHGVAILGLVIWPMVAVAQPTNPVEGVAPVSFVDAAIIAGGQGTVSGSILYDLSPTATNPNRGAWVPQLQPWNNRNTAAGNRIGNMDNAGADFPLTATLRDGRVVRITAANCDAHWDRVFRVGERHPNGARYRRVSSATLNMNCYGYSTGKGYWVNSPGFNVIMQDEYVIFQASFCRGGCILKLSGDHCISLVDCCCPGVANPPLDTIKVTREKINTSGVYEGTWDCPPGYTPHGTIYCKKN